MIAVYRLILIFPRGLCPKDKNTTASTSSNQDPQTSGGHRPTPSTNRSRSRGTISDGSLVRLKNGPPCGPNSIVYSRSLCGPRVGKTMNIIEHGSLDPKTSVLVKVFKDDHHASSDDGNKASWMDFDSRLLPELDSNSSYNSLEVWKLSDVVFLDDSPAILGRVVTVDHPQVIVDISHSTSESGTLASSSNAKSTLKVFKVSELELCPIDYGDGSVSQSQPQSQSRQQQQPKKTNMASTLSLSDTKSSQNRGGVSHHVAGTVQHHPVCILAPEPTSSNGSSLLQQQGSAAGSVINGYTPLALTTTDEGPTMLLERASDSATFLVHSGHTEGGALVSTSFVALNCKDSKPNLFTIEEESIPALEGGFRADPVVLSYNRASVDSQLCADDGAACSNVDQGTSVSTGAKVSVGSRVTKGKSKASSGSGGRATSTPVKLIDVEAGDAAKLPRRSSRKRKLDKGGKMSTTTTISAPDDQTATGTSLKLQAPTESDSDKATTLATPVTKAPKMRDIHPSALKSSLVQPTVAKLTSQPLLMWDVNGMVCPLLDGLNLRPVPGKASFSLPTMSYSFVSSRQHAITRTQNVCVLTLGKSLLRMLRFLVG